MDKYEYKVRADEIETLIAEGDYAEAVKIADTIDWRRVKSVRMLCRISDLYKINKRYEDSRDILLLAYERHTGGRLIVYSLCELSIKLGEYVQAVEYYKEFVQMAPKDSGKYILQYKLYEAQEVSLEERIEVLEELKKADYREKWAYELAYLYHRVGLTSKCVDECNEMVLWFGEGRYVLKALELKMLHEPLTEEQEIKYELMKLNGGSAAPSYAAEQKAQPEKAEEPAEEEFSLEENILAEDTQEIPGNELNIHVKTVDVSPYNTINLQRELAESMKEILEEHNPAEEVEEEDDVLQTQIFEPVIGYDSQLYSEKEAEEAAEEILETVQESEASVKGAEPTLYLRQDTDEMRMITDADLGEEASEEAQETDFEEEQEPSAVAAGNMSGSSEEVFFGNTSEVNIEEVVSELAQKNAARTPFTPILAVDPKDMQVQMEMDFSDNSGEAKAKMPVASADPAISNTGVIRTFHKPSGYDNILSQEYDGQISLVIPEQEKVEKQITGQISIEDVMAEWERMKQESERKRLEEIKKRVQLQTDTLFADFDESTKSGLLEELEKTMVAAALKEEKERVVAGRPKVVKVSDIEKAAETNKDVKKVQAEPEAADDELQNVVEMVDESVLLAEAEADIEEEKVAASQRAAVTATAGAAAKDVIEESGETEELEEIETEAEEAAENESEEEIEIDDEAGEDEAEDTEAGDVKDIETDEEEAIRIEAISAEEQTVAAIAKSVENGEDADEAATATDSKYKAREMTAAEREQFAPFIHHKRTRRQIVEAIDNISMASYTGNVLITGEEGTGSTALAKLLVKEIQLSDNNFSGKVAKISGTNMNKKDVAATLDKLSNGALIIEDASGMKKSTVNALLKELNQEEKGLIVMLEDTKADIEEILAKYPKVAEAFNLRVDVEALDDQTLVKYAKKYALEQEYSIDDLGILALHTRIADMQTSEHEVTMAEIEELVDEAIYYADRKTPAHFFDILFGKRYDEEDMIVLREKDFMHY